MEKKNILKGISFFAFLFIISFSFASFTGIPECGPYYCNIFETNITCKESINFITGNNETRNYVSNDGVVGGKELNNSTAYNGSKSFTKIPWLLQQNISGEAKINGTATYKENYYDTLTTITKTSNYSRTCSESSNECTDNMYYFDESNPSYQPFTQTYTVPSHFYYFYYLSEARCEPRDGYLIYYPSTATPDPNNDPPGYYKSCNEKYLEYEWIKDYHHTDDFTFNNGEDYTFMEEYDNLIQNAKIARAYNVSDYYSYFNETTNEINVTTFVEDFYHWTDSGNILTDCNSTPLTFKAYLYLNEIPYYNYQTNEPITYGVDVTKYDKSYGAFMFPSKWYNGPLTTTIPSFPGNVLIGSINLTKSYNAYGDIIYSGKFSNWVNNEVIQKFSNPQNDGFVYLVIKAPNSVDPYASITIPIYIGYQGNPLDLPAFCGDGLLDPTEECDTADPYGAYNCASGLCNNDCTCESVCGNGILDYTWDWTEECDTTYGSQNCNEPTTENECNCKEGYVAELDAWRYPTGNCIEYVPGVCGDGILDPNEECDPNDPWGAYNCDSWVCNNDCNCASTCGDNYFYDWLEECDTTWGSQNCNEPTTENECYCKEGYVADGFGNCVLSCIEDDYCNPLCLSDPDCCEEDDWCNPLCENDPDCLICGNGIVEEGEECGETGLSCSTYETCLNCQCEPTCIKDNYCNPLCPYDPDCLICGNGIIEEGEECEMNSDCPPQGRPLDILCINCTCWSDGIPSIIYHDAKIIESKKIETTIQCDTPVSIVNFLLKKDENMTIINYYNEDGSPLTQDPTCPETKTKYILETEENLEPTIIYSLTASIPVACIQCKIEVFLSYLETEKGLNIDDNNYLFTAIIALFALFVATRKKNKVKK